MSPLRLLIVDDEPPAVRLLTGLAAAVEGFQVVASAHDVPSARGILESTPIDLVLLDIAMPGADGFALIEQVGIDRMPFVIFVTAHGEHALRAFDVRALDYVMKPPTSARFNAALERAAELIRTRPPRERQPRLRELLRQIERTEISATGPHMKSDTAASGAYVQQLLIRNRDGFEKIPVETIVWCEAEDHYVRIHTTAKSYLYTGNLSSLAMQLDPAEFARVRRDAIIRYRAIESVATGSFGTLRLTLLRKQQIVTSRTLEAAVKLRCLSHARPAQ